jgi:hypothetical protein
LHKLIRKQKPTGSTEVPDIVLEEMRVKEAVEEHLLFEALVKNSPDSTVPDGINENLE